MASRTHSAASGGVTAASGVAAPSGPSQTSTQLWLPLIVVQVGTPDEFTESS